MKNNTKNIIKTVGGIALFIGMMFLLGYTLKELGLENTRKYIDDAGPLAPIFFIIVCAISMIFAPLSGSTFYVTGGVIFGKEFGYLYSLIAIMLGCSANYFISKKLGQKAVLKLTGKNSKKVDKLSKGGYAMIFLLALFFSDFASYIAGLTKMKYKQFLTIFLVANMIGVFFYIYIGSGLLEWIFNQK